MLIERYNDAGDKVLIDENDTELLATWAAKGYRHEAKPEEKPIEAPKPTPRKKYKAARVDDAPAPSQPFPSEEGE